MYCKNCGKEILEDFGTCPYCKTPIDQTKNSYNYNQQKTKKFIPYYKRPNSIYQKYPFLSWSITIIGIVISLYLCFSNTLDFAKNYDQSSSTKKTTNNPSVTTIYPTTTTLKNYQQIYNEYSQKLISSGPTSSINEMAEICNEGIGKMAQYMYSASGTDGQYATYQSWADKLYDVYLNNCR